jgi:hypothetical protein
MSYSDLRDFESEHTTRDDETGWSVEIEKLGGGTEGRSYAGTWRYIVTRPDGHEIARGQNYVAGTPKTHEQVARDVIDFLRPDAE